jgi:hypothetical protein
MQVKQTLVIAAKGADYLSKAGIAHRYDVTVRTVDRWKASPKLDFPAPDLVINHREYTKVTTIEAWERKRAANAAA